MLFPVKDTPPLTQVHRLGRRIGSGARAYVFECDVDGKAVALKIYFDKRCLENELEVYKRLHNAPSAPNVPQYHGLFEVSSKALAGVAPRPSPDGRTLCQPYHIGLGIQRCNGTQLDQVVTDLPEEQLRKLEQDLLATLRFLHDEGVCHGDVRGANILVEHEEETAHFLLLDFSESVIIEGLSARQWATGRARDLGYLREIFSTARAEQAASLGLQIINDAQAETGAAKIDRGLTAATVARLSDLLETASWASSPHTRLVEAIQQAFPSPTPQLGLVLAQSLHSLGEFTAANELVRRLILGATGPDLWLLPHLERQIALTMQARGAVGATIMPHFDRAVDGLTLQLGPTHITTLNCLYDRAMQYANMKRVQQAVDILGGIIHTIEEEGRCSGSDTRLTYLCTSRLEEFRQAERRKRKFYQDRLDQPSPKRACGTYSKAGV